MVSEQCGTPIKMLATHCVFSLQWWIPGWHVETLPDVLKGSACADSHWVSCNCMLCQGVLVMSGHGVAACGLSRRMVSYHGCAGRTLGWYDVSAC